MFLNYFGPESIPTRDRSLLLFSEKLGGLENMKEIENYAAKSSKPTF